jgi:3',5'-cyclic AMP phosphodiesterase CpdA
MGFAFDAWGYEASVLYETSRDYLSVYFRRQFDVVDPQTVTWLALRVDYDGGFIAYLNGAEIARRGLPGPAGSPAPFNLPAEYHARTGAEDIDVSQFRRLLQAGPNLLAIQWHNSVPTTSGAGFVAELFANFTRGPFVQNTTTTSQQLIWKTMLPCDTVVEYGDTAALGQRFVDAGLTTNHLATLTNLAPDTLYYYRAVSSTGDQTAASSLHSFRTLKPSGPLVFVALADVGLGSTAQYAVARVMENIKPDLVIVPGDLIYPYFTLGRADFRFFSVYRPVMLSVPFFPTVGNHEVMYGGDKYYFELFYLPTNSVPLALHQAALTGPEHYYSFDHGDAHFASLFLPALTWQFTLTNGSPQVEWLKADLAASAKPWKFVYLHPPLFTSGWHRGDDYNYNSLPDETEVAQVLLPIAREHGVQLIITAHDHTYEKFAPVMGVHCVLSGGGGGYLYGLDSLAPNSAAFWSRYHLLKVSISGDSLQMEAIDSEGKVFDYLYIQRALPLPQTHPAVWHTPVLESGPADDGDGNIQGQTFDLAGPGLPSMPGDFSNLGRAYVNYDHANLYLGLEQTMLYADNNVFLFLQSPQLPGVTNLVGLGNGLVDPDGQGVDGVDFLENLAFTNFAPCIVCVLGDEYADGQYRSFARTNFTSPIGNWWPWSPAPGNLALNIGQGVYYLDAAFSDVPGARLQQFNRSPQSGLMLGEQNASFIELAIPLAALGLRHGDFIKLGAVVGGGGFSTNVTEQTRFLDRSFLGQSLTGSGQGPVLLEGVEFQLGPDLDLDGDGLTMEEELQRGTDPQRADTDADGLPDGWEVAFSLNPLVGAGIDGPDGDPDGDGLTNRQEYLAGTHPRNAQSTLRISLADLRDGQLRLSWLAVPGKKYQIQAADSAAGPYADFPLPGFPRLANTAYQSYVGPELALSGPGVRFLRLRLVP